MNFRYTAYKEDDPNPFEGMDLTDGRKTKKTVTINITIEMEEDKYIAKRNKYKEPIPKKVYKIFK